MPGPGTRARVLPPRSSMSSSASDARAESLALVCGDSEHELVGATRLLSGSRWIRGADNTLHTAVFDGDRVRVRGTVEAIAGGDSGYRDAARQWRIVGREDCPIDIVADEVRVPAPPIRELPRSLIVAGGLFLLVTYIAGAIGSKHTGDVFDSGGEIQVPAGLRVASATPFHRDDALRSMGDQISMRSQGTGLLSLADVELELLQGDCRAAVESALRRAELQLALDVAQTCPSTPDGIHALAQANFALGNLAALSEQLTHYRVMLPDEAWPFDSVTMIMLWGSAMRLHLLAARYDRAVDIAERVIPALEAQAERMANDGDRETDPQWPRFQADALACVAHALRIRTGQKKSFDGLGEAAKKMPECQLLLADSTPIEERAEALIPDPDGAKWTISSSDGERLSNLLRAETGRWGEKVRQWGRQTELKHLITTDISRMRYDTALIASALAGLGRASTENELLARAAMGAELAYQRESWRRKDNAEIAEQASQDIDRARALIAKRLSPPQEFPYDATVTRYSILLLRAAIAGRAGEVARAKALREAAITVFRERMVRHNYDEKDIKRGLYINFGPNGFVPPGTLTGPFPRDEMIEKRIELGSSYHAKSHDPGDLRFHAGLSTGMSYPDRWVRDLIDSRDMAELAGGTEWQEELDRAIESWWQVWSNRDIGVLLEMLEAIEY